MRISDWSSDVCSSDLRASLRWRPDDRRDGGDRRRLAAGLLSEAGGPARHAVDAAGAALRVATALAGRRGEARKAGGDPHAAAAPRSEEHTSELQSLMRISYAVFCLKKKKTHKNHQTKRSK